MANTKTVRAVLIDPKTKSATAVDVEMFTDADVSLWRQHDVLRWLDTGVIKDIVDNTIRGTITFIGLGEDLDPGEEPAFASIIGVPPFSGRMLVMGHRDGKFCNSPMSAEDVLKAVDFGPFKGVTASFKDGTPYVEATRH